MRRCQHGQCNSARMLIGGGAGAQNLGYTLFPHKDRLQCTTAVLDAGSGPTRQGDGAPAAPAAGGVAPELSASARRRLLSPPSHKPELTFVRVGLD